MSDPRGALRTDPHSHHDVPQEPTAVRLPGLVLQYADGSLSEIGAAVYAAHAFRHRWLDTLVSDERHAYLLACREIGSHVYWYIEVATDILR